MTMYQSQLNFMPVRVGNKKVKPLRLIRHVIVPPIYCHADIKPKGLTILSADQPLQTLQLQKNNTS